MQEVILLTGLSRKAIEDLIGQGLICPLTSDSVYRSFGHEDLLRLKKAHFDRRPDPDIPEIRRAPEGNT